MSDPTKFYPANHHLIAQLTALAKHYGPDGVARKAAELAGGDFTPGNRPTPQDECNHEAWVEVLSTTPGPLIEACTECGFTRRAEARADETSPSSSNSFAKAYGIADDWNER